MSLWKVSDQATDELMVSFYRHWLRSGDMQTSFREAQEDLMLKYPHPFYWGAFVLLGK